MTTLNAHTHCASVEVAVPASTAFQFMADGMKQTHWTLGSWNRRDLGDGLFAGTSLWDDTELYIRPVPEPKLKIVDYYVGTDPADLHFGVTARIISGETLGVGENRSLITLMIWRDSQTSDDEWDRTAYVWPTEVQLIRGRIELERESADVAGSVDIE